MMLQIRLPSSFSRRKCVRGGLCTAGILLLYWLTRAPIDLPGVYEPQPSQHYRFPHNYDALMEPGPEVCSGRVHLLILVASALNHGKRRQAVRDTWGSPENLQHRHAKIVFLLGSTEERDGRLESELEREMARHKDILREQYIDSYANLTIKSIGGFKWAVNKCPQAEFVMKTDDDIYVNVARLTGFLEARRADRHAIYGCIKNGPQGAPSPMSASGMQFRSVHPPFTAGAGYIIAADILPLISNISQNIKIIRVEDAFITGYCAARLDRVNRIHDNQFSCGQMVNRNCDMKELITGHKIDPDRMRDIHAHLQYHC